MIRRRQQTRGSHGLPWTCTAPEAARRPVGRAPRRGGGGGMITYRKGFPAPMSLVWRLYGASTGRALPFAIAATLLTGVLHAALGHGSVRMTYADGWNHPYPFQTFAYIAGFAVVFRNNFAYQR